KPECERENGGDRRQDDRQHNRNGIDQDCFVGDSDRTLWIKDIHRRTRKWTRYRGPDVGRPIRRQIKLSFRKAASAAVRACSHCTVCCGSEEDQKKPFFKLQPC